MHESTLSRFNSPEGAERYAAKFDRRWEERLRNWNEQRLVASLLSMIPLSDLKGMVLDVPTGIGRFYEALRERTPNVVQSDWSYPMLQLARSANGSAAVGQIRALAADLPFPSETFDLVFSVRLCHHFPTQDERTRYIEEVLRVSRKWVILTYLDSHSFHHVVRSASRRLVGKPVKWSMSSEEVMDAASRQGFEVMDSTLLSPVFSGQRYAVMMRTQSHRAVSRGVENEEAPPQRAAAPPRAVADRMRPAVDAVCAWAHRWQTLLLSPLMIFCLFSNIGAVERDSVVLPIGLMVFIAGVALRVWSQLHSHHRFRTHMAFSTTGPFAWVRNPIQLGNTAIMVGLCIFSEVVYFVPVVAFWAILVYSLAGRYEERRLIQNCGQKYRDYLARVPRWLPRVPAKRLAADVRPYCAMSLRGEQYTLLMLLPYAILELFTS